MDRSITYNFSPVTLGWTGIDIWRCNALLAQSTYGERYFFDIEPLAILLYKVHLIALRYPFSLQDDVLSIESDEKSII